MGMLSLESSINSEGGLGLVTGAIPFLVLALAGILAPGIAKLIGSKNSITVGYFGFLVFVIANYYPDRSTLIAAAIVAGLLINIAVVSVYAHATIVARLHFKSIKETQENATYLYSSFVALSAKSSNIFSNLSSSVILFISPTDHGSEGNGKICNNNEASQLKDSDITIYYLLVTVYASFCVLGIIVVILLVDHFSVDNQAKIEFSRAMIKEYLVMPVCDIIESLTNFKMLLLIPIFILEGLLIGFITGLFTKASPQYF